MSNFVNKVLLFPYYALLAARNRAYDKGRRKTADYSSYGDRVISVGNIAMGGTGKTPHVEMFIRHFLEKGKTVAVVSRGYKRKTKEPLEVTVGSSALEVGDEPLQIKCKFPQVRVFVNKKREETVEMLINPPLDAPVDYVILDDAHQYRRLIPGRSIVLIDYNRPVFKDNLFPFGRLRDLPEQIRRADTVIITRSPAWLDEWQKEKIKAVNKVSHNQRLFFTKIDYCKPVKVFEEADGRFIYSQECILFTGIADPLELRNFLTTKYAAIYQVKYPDHHQYTRRDLKALARLARKYPAAVLLTTEKDAQRLNLVADACKPIATRLFYVPIETRLIEGESDLLLYESNDRVGRSLERQSRPVNAERTEVYSADLFGNIE